LDPILEGLDLVEYFTARSLITGLPGAQFIQLSPKSGSPLISLASFGDARYFILNGGLCVVKDDV
jgi:hypothetical protein